MEARPLLRIAARFRAACDRHGALFIVNDRPDLALAAGADGVHLGQDDLDPSFARSLGLNIIGRSTHTPDELHRAFDEDVDYICVGPVHETPTKPGRPATGLDLIRLAAKSQKPWFAIGGMNPDTAAEAVEAGASRIVVVRAITEAPDPAAAVAGLRALLPVPQA
jgi:thiamine-phosphate pyrophosphorylase